MEINSGLEWESAFNNCFKLAQTTLNSINERIIGLRAGTPRQVFVSAHQRNIQSSKQLETNITQLKSSLDYLVKTKDISVQDMQMRDQKLQRLIKLLNEIKKKLNFSEADIMNQGREELLAGNIQREKGENEETRALSNDEMVQTYETFVENQDQLLDQLHENLQREKQASKGISDELDLQEKLIDKVTDKTTGADRRTRFLTKKTMHIEKKSTACCLYILIVLLLVLLIAMVVSGNFKMGYYNGK